MELNTRSIEYKPYCRLLEEYKDGIVQDDEIILVYRSNEGIILNWFYSHDIMEDYDPTIVNNTVEEQGWILQYIIGKELDSLTEGLVLDVILELEYRLLGSPNIKELREELGLSITELAIQLRIPTRTLERIEKGLELPPNYFMRSIYVRLVNEVEHNRFKDRIEKLGEENPNDNFMDLLYKDLFDNQNNEALEAVNAEMPEDSIDNLERNNFEDEELYITPSKLAIEELYITPSKSAIEEFMKKLKDNN